ncbi:MAG: hypothetical protein GXP53_05555 [Deltaproteobacteria bacterium]|nr:hypothetical protein [Deltaproteobacteria bacterium]
MAKHCKYCRYISDYIDGELSVRMADRLILHMETCGRCREMLARFSGIDEDIGILSEIEPSPDFNRRFWRTLDGQRERGFQTSFAWLFSGWRPALAAAAAIMIVFGTVILHGNRFLSKNVTAGAPVSEMAMAKNLDLFENYDMIENLSMLEHFDEISAPISTTGENS